MNQIEVLMKKNNIIENYLETSLIDVEENSLYSVEYKNYHKIIIQCNEKYLSENYRIICDIFLSYYKFRKLNKLLKDTELRL